MLFSVLWLPAVVLVGVAAIPHAIDQKVDESRAPQQTENRQAGATTTVTSTTVTTVVSTSVILTSTLCASFVNATSACRRRSGSWVDQPVILALDEQLDDVVARQLDPSFTASVEPTSKSHLLISSSSVDIESSQEGTKGSDFRTAEPIYFEQLAAIFPVFSAIFGLSSTVTETSTSTRTVTTLSYSTTGTSPIIYSGCSPAAASQYSKC